MSRFLNVTEINTRSVKGSQVKITFDKKESQPFVGSTTTKDKNEQLKIALILRNNKWLELGITSRYILLQKLPLCVKSMLSNTGFHGLSIQKQKERRANRNKTTTQVIGMCVRNLNTGRVTNKKITIHLYKNFDSALRKAKAKRNANIKAYNNIVEVYNYTMLGIARKLEQTEMVTLTPRLHILKKFNPSIWDESINTVYVNGLPNV